MQSQFQYPIRSCRVVDGDTVDCELSLGFSIYTSQSCRLVGIDAPEHTNAAGQLVTQVVAQWFTKQAGALSATSQGWDKFGGRFDGVISSDANVLTLNGYLLQTQLTRAYNGGAKPPWTQAELAAIEKRAKEILAQ